MLDSLNATFEGLDFEMNGSTLTVSLEDAQFEFDLEDQEMIGTLRSFEGFEADLAQLDRFQTTLENAGISTDLIYMMNHDGALNRVFGFTIPEVTNENGEAVAQMCMEGFGNTMTRAWDAIVQFFKNLIMRIKAWFGKIISFRNSIEKKLTDILSDIKARYKEDLRPNWVNEKISGYKYDNFKSKTELIKNTIASITDIKFSSTNLTLTPYKLNEFCAVVLRKKFESKTSGKDERNIKSVSLTPITSTREDPKYATSTDTISNMGYKLESKGNNGTLISALEAALDNVKTARDLDKFAADAQRGINDAMSSAKRDISKGGVDTEAYRTARAQASQFSMLVTISTAVYREACKDGRFAIKLGKMVPVSR